MPRPVNQIAATSGRPAQPLGTSSLAHSGAAWWPLEVDAGHPLRRVALAGDRRQLCVDPGEILLAELDLGRGRVLLQVLTPLRPRNRDDVAAAGEHPGECKLRG